MKWLLLLLGSSFASDVYGQNIDLISSKWNDSYREWVLLDENDDDIGFIKLKWDLADDFSEWTYELGDLRGDIKRKWRDDPNYWEIFSNDGLVSARPVFRGDFRSWTISHKNTIYRLRHNWGYDWSMDRTPFHMVTYYESDPRDWVIEELLIDMPMDVKMMAIFLVLYHSTPQE